MEDIHLNAAMVANPSTEMLALLDEFDAKNEALVVGHFLNPNPEFAGRAFLAFRRPDWIALEDKVTIDAFWDRHAVLRARSVVCSIREPQLSSISASLDRGSGVVWAGDASEGFHGGAELTRWIRSPRDYDEALRTISQHCTWVRIMPFLEGIPCSIHGIVFPDYVAAVRPMEMVTLRRASTTPGKGLLSYCGAASFYDPPGELRVQMRSLAKCVGAALRSEVDFRGCFTIDGIATHEGFIPTELNPRLGAALNTATRGMPDLPINLLLDVLVSGHTIDVDPVEFERDLVTSADSIREGGTWKGFPGKVVPECERDATYDRASRAWHWSAVDEPVTAKVATGTRGSTGFARGLFVRGNVPEGPSVAPLAASLWGFLDAEFALAIGTLGAAVDVHRSEVA